MDDDDVLIEVQSIVQGETRVFLSLNHLHCVVTDVHLVDWWAAVGVSGR